MADIHLHERLAKQKEALSFVANHDAITHRNVQLAAQHITETIAITVTATPIYNDQSVASEFILFCE